MEHHHILLEIAPSPFGLADQFRFYFLLYGGFVSPPLPAVCVLLKLWWWRWLKSCVEWKCLSPQLAASWVAGQICLLSLLLREQVKPGLNSLTHSLSSGAVVGGQRKTSLSVSGKDDLEGSVWILVMVAVVKVVVQNSMLVLTSYVTWLLATISSCFISLCVCLFVTFLCISFQNHKSVFKRLSYSDFFCDVLTLT